MSSRASRPSRTDRRRIGLQIALLYAVLEGALWTSGEVQTAFVSVVVVILVGATLWERRFWPGLGIDLKSITRALWFAPVAAALAGLILLAAWMADTLHVPPDIGAVWLQGLAYFPWALTQQFILQSYLFTRLEWLFGSRCAVLGTALLFSIAHIPNPVLVPVTLVGGLILCELFRRYRTLYVLALAHALVAVSLAVSVPESLLHHMGVGIAYFPR
jgi:membrane protease YdiL (CAAX protease family)